MGRPAGWMTELTGRSPMKSPGAPWTATNSTDKAQVAHQALHGATGHADVLSVELRPHLVRAIHTEVVRMNPGDLDLEDLVALRTLRRRPAPR